jgi:hypothetical protein
MIEELITFQESPPASPEPRKRGSLSALFENLGIKDYKKSETKSRRKSKPLPPTPPEESHFVEPGSQLAPPTLLTPQLPAFKPLLPDIQSEVDIKRICIPEERWNQQQSVIGYSLQGWTKIKATDSQGRKETFYYHQEMQKKIRGCCIESENLIPCCALCKHDQWIFQGSEYDPSITVLYAQMDGCIPASVKLLDPKFIIPWRYKNRRSGKVSWKIIHMCGSNMEDAECETIVVNTFRDKKLRKIIETVKVEAVW